MRPRPTWSSPLVPLVPPPSRGSVHVVHVRFHRIRLHTGPLRRPPAASRHPPGGAASRGPPAPVSELEQALNASLDAPPGPADFAALRLPQPLLTGLQRRGISTPFPIQARTLPDALAGRDVLGRAETGSGKTLAFGLPMLARLIGGTGARPARPRGLVLVPTRELAQQVQDALAPLGQPLGVGCSPSTAAPPMGRQIAALRRGVDLVVATPGRLLDLIQQGECSLDRGRGHRARRGRPHGRPRLPARRHHDPRHDHARGQRLLFSATLDRGVDRLVRAYLTDPAAHAVASAASPVSSMDHLASRSGTTTR